MSAAKTKSFESVAMLRAAVVAHALITIAGFFFIGGNEMAPPDIRFGFGPYVANLVESGRYIDCEIPTICKRASRMPVFPYLAAASFMLSGSLVGLMISKSVLFAGGAYHYMASSWSRMSGINRSIVLFVLLNPLLLKHLFTPHYEEFLSGELLLIYVLSLNSLAVSRRPADMYVNAVLASALYLLKTTYLPLLIVSAIFQAMYSRKVSNALIALFLIVGPFAAWGVHLKKTGADRIYGSSWDAENLYRGVSPVASQLYPRVSLDNLFYTTEFIAADGTRLELDELPAAIVEARAATSEWQWFDVYMRHAKEIIRTQPEQVVAFFAKKAWYVLLGLHDKLRDPMAPETTTIVVFLFFFLRALWLHATAVVLFVTRGLTAAAYVLIAGALLAPLIIGFAYERHLTVSLSALMLASAIMQTERLPLGNLLSKSGPGSSDQVWRH